MRLHYGAVPETPDFHPLEEGWTGIREPGPVLIQFLAIPVALAVIFLLMAVLIFSRPGLAFTIRIDWITLVMILLLFPVHELLHALCFPQFGFTSETVVGAWASRLLLYAFYTGALPKWRFLLVYAMPLMVLSALPVAFLAVVRPVPFASGVISALVILAILNAAAASGDIIGFFLVLFQVPSGAQVRNQGWKTFWKKAIS
jgi:hypothetical protein